MPAQQLVISQTFQHVGELQRVLKKLHVHTYEDFYAIPKTYITSFCKSSLLKQHGTVEGLVKKAFPHHKWDHDKFVQPRRAIFTPQIFLQRIIRTLFGAEVPIRSNVRDEFGPKSLEIDIFLPSLRVGFEYQDPHHYFHSVFGKETLDSYRARDEKKKQLAAERGIVLINVPFWWDWNEASLISTVKFKRPDLLAHLSSDAPPFPDVPPQDVIDRYDFEIPGFGAPMFALHSPQNHTFNPIGWYMYEKYDGIRGLWSPVDRTMYSRWGRPIGLQRYHVDCMPNVWLDGELWFGRGKENRYLVRAIVVARPHLVNWEKLRYMVFDCPNPDVQNEPYITRYAVLRRILPEAKHFVSLAGYKIVKTKEEIESFFFTVRSNGGEGVILREPLAGYIHGYSRCLFKHKGYLDAEAKVVQKLPNNKFLCKVNKLVFVHNIAAYNPAYELDEHEDMWEIEMPIDPEFFEGASQEIEIGDFVSFRYAGNFPHDLTPINPKIYAIRHDITSWAQLLKGKRKQFNHKPIWKPKPAPLVSSHTWTAERARKAFNELAAEMNFDPLVPSRWYNVPRRRIVEKAQGFVEKYEFPMMALRDAYPDIGLRLHLFPQTPREFFKRRENLKAFFDDFASSKQLDPLSPDTWYKVEVANIESFKPGITKMFYRLFESIRAAIKTAYPDIKWVDSKFAVVSWMDKANQRKFFDDFAKEHNFDPLKPDNWTKWRAILYSRKGYNAVVAKYGSFPKAMAHLYPNVTWPLNLRK
eukprot:Phypoly_transcript_03820.p1 GENE.Phypoly_transcript_03820~~Phypoly_transcript_03820.p1  ORF type:complete len:752 (+),score=55.45 Phypoly_transcript_03820:18-2273(+)